MMMSCPRCGFSQPEDRFCAQCGLDISHFQPKKQSFLTQVAQNPTLHLFLIGSLVLVTIGYIFYSQRELLGNEVGGFFKDLPLLSRDSTTGEVTSADQLTSENEAAQVKAIPNQGATGDSQDDLNAEQAENEIAKDLDGPASSLSGSELVVSFWEVSRETIASLAPTADKSNDGGEGRIMVWAHAGKIVESVDDSGQRLEGGKDFSLNQSPVMVEDGVEGSPLQFSTRLDLSKSPSGEFNVKFSVNWHLPEGNEVGRYVDASIDGTAVLPFKGLIMVVMDPAERTVKSDLLRTVNGPLTILGSEEFKQGATEWVMLVHGRVLPGGVGGATGGGASGASGSSAGGPSGEVMGVQKPAATTSAPTNNSDSPDSN